MDLKKEKDENVKTCLSPFFNENISIRLKIKSSTSIKEKY